MSSVLDTKLFRLFDILDADGDGRIVPVDLSGVAARLARVYGDFAGAPKVDELERVLLGLWDTDLARMDADGDGRIDRDEFVAGVREAAAADPAGFADRFTALVDAWMDVCDTNGDGVIEKDEYVRMYHATYGIGEAELAEAFDRLDRHGRGALTVDDVRRATLEYYTSNDPDAPGNALFGPF
ncbi:EF-hand domain-containing protein [Actinomadura parmotrematis]|uniref:EF-hand domain-containing protein n=1 Tax=Actinomadura parmotrematis TaxID=2864039 RepID=A0ABS7FR95_9ACTN|nr:EF-hand domain-containing protein [Actinomadura parmotrematis]MBW8482929.1 EF-hand domain-containing protein [Actinomadura parmotrematis]